MSATHRVTWNGDHPTFHCDGDETSPCHIYPDCECQYWDLNGPDGTHVHPDVPHARCWRLDWLDATPFDAYYDGGTGTGDVPPRIDGLIETEWEGDCLLWCYADSDAVEAAFAAVSS